MGQDIVEVCLLILEKVEKVPSDTIDRKAAGHILVGDFAGDVFVHSDDRDLLTATSGKVERGQQPSLSRPAFGKGQVLTVRGIDLPNDLVLRVDVYRDVFDG